MDVRAEMLIFPGFWGPWPKFWAGISARMIPGCPRDIRPKNFLFGLNFRSWLSWGALKGWRMGGPFLPPQPPHTRQKYEQKYGPQTAEFALFWSIWGHILSRFLFIFLPCMWGAGVTGVFLRRMGDPFFTTTGADAPERSTGKNQHW